MERLKTAMLLTHLCNFLSVQEEKASNLLGHPERHLPINNFSAQRFQVVVTYSHITTFCSLRTVSCYALGTTLLQQRQKEHMAGNTSTDYWIPNSHSLPMYLIIQQTTTNSIDARPSFSSRALIYLSFGLLPSATNFLYSTGLLHIPASIFSLVCVSQLAFSALFSFLLNSQKFTPYIINSLGLLTISSSLLVFHTNSLNQNEITKDEYTVGLICTIGASAGYGLMLPLTQFSFQRVLKTETFKVVLEMMIFQSLVATCATMMGLYISKEGTGLKTEMEEFGPEMLSYFIILGCIAIAWQIFTIGTTGLIFDVSSLFSNVISVLGLPLVSVLAVIFFHDAMDGVKVSWLFGALRHISTGTILMIWSSRLKEF